MWACDTWIKDHQQPTSHIADKDKDIQTKANNEIKDQQHPQITYCQKQLYKVAIVVYL